MRLGPRVRGVVLLTALGASLLLVSQASLIAHEERKLGELTVEVGWLDEPPFTGFLNAVVVNATRNGEPAEQTELEVELIFGGRNSEVVSQPLALEPVLENPGEYRASVIPTRPGTYTFHVIGVFAPGLSIDDYFTSGEGTFDDVRDPAEVQFPAQDPTTGELAEALQRLSARVGQDSGGALNPGSDDTARILAIAGIALGVLALISATLAVRRAGR